MQRVACAADKPSQHVALISIQAARLLSPFGDLEATFDAIAAGKRSSGKLTGPLLDQVMTVIEDGPWNPDLVLFASTKGDGPLWIEDCLGEQIGRGGPGWLARQVGSRLGCPGMAVSVACASGPGALAVASLAMNQGDYERVLIIGGDRLMPMVTAGFESLRAIDPHGARPFDSERQGLSLGETIAALWCQRGGNGPFFLNGWGLSCDANHLTGPHREGAGLLRACLQTTTNTDKGKPTEIDLIVAHGTGTKYNDDAESHAYAQLSPETPVTGWKGSLGHSLGSCGIAEVALSCLSLQRQMTPGVCGLKSTGTAQPLHLLKQGLHPLPIKHIISANAGFGGLNGVVLVSSQGIETHSTDKRQSDLFRTMSFDHESWSWHSSPQNATHSGRWDTAILPTEMDALPRFTSRYVTGQRDSSWGRMDHYCRLAVTLTHYVQSQIGPLGENTALLLLSDRGCAESDRHCERNRQQHLEDPQRFAYTLPSTALGEVSIRFGIKGPAIALPGADDTQGANLAR